MIDLKKSNVLYVSSKGYKNIEVTNEFTISIGDAAHVVECDYVGIVS